MKNYDEIMLVYVNDETCRDCINNMESRFDNAVNSIYNNLEIIRTSEFPIRLYDKIFQIRRFYWAVAFNALVINTPNYYTLDVLYDYINKFDINYYTSRTIVETYNIMKNYIDWSLYSNVAQGMRNTHK